MINHMEDDFKTANSPDLKKQLLPAIEKLVGSRVGFYQGQFSWDTRSCENSGALHTVIKVADKLSIQIDHHSEGYHDGPDSGEDRFKIINPAALNSEKLNAFSAALIIEAEEAAQKRVNRLISNKLKDVAKAINDLEGLQSRPSSLKTLELIINNPDLGLSEDQRASLTRTIHRLEKKPNDKRASDPKEPELKP